jgi:hypothetical protein
VVLVRSQHRSWALGLEPATAAARWRPNGDGVRVASAGDARKGGEQKWRRQGATRGRGIQQEVVLGKLRRRWAAAAEAEQRRSRGARGGRRQTGVRRTDLQI